MTGQGSANSIWAVTDVPPRLGYPNGFSSRVYHFLKSVAECWPLDVLALRREGADWTRENFLPDDLPVCHFWYEPLPADPLNSPGVKGRLRRAGHYLRDPLPYMSYPRRLAGLNEHLSVHAPRLAIFFLPYTAHLALQLPASVPRVYVLEEGWERSLDWATRNLPAILRVWVNGTEKARVDRLYRRIASRGEPVVAISNIEKDWFKRVIPEDQITTIPHAVDCEFFSPESKKQDLDISIFGNFSQGRTGKEAVDLYRYAESSVRRTGVRRTWAFVGKGPTDEMLALRSSQAMVTGQVPDFRPYYARTKVVVVPASYGTGVKTTVLEAWATGRPVVATSFALNGLPASPGENVLVGDTPGELLGHVRSLLDSPDLRLRLGEAGLETVRRERNIHVLAKNFAELCADTLRANPSTTW